MSEYYEYDNEGNLHKVSCETLPSGKFKFVGDHLVRVSATPQPPVHYSSSDVIGGVQGIKSHADGKYYDSKAAYYKSLKAQGMVVLGTDAPKENKRELKSNIDWKTEVRKTISNLKGKKK